MTRTLEEIATPNLEDLITEARNGPERFAFETTGPVVSIDYMGLRLAVYYEDTDAPRRLILRHIGDEVPVGDEFVVAIGRFHLYRTT